DKGEPIVDTNLVKLLLRCSMGVAICTFPFNILWYVCYPLMQCDKGGSRHLLVLSSLSPNAHATTVVNFAWLLQFICLFLCMYGIRRKQLHSFNEMIISSGLYMFSR
ncbi:hypothetical protein Drorol1_Dr00002093, partial [Drosera rotundifolia]